MDRLVEQFLTPPALDIYQVYTEHNNHMKEGIIARVTDRGFGFIKVDGMEKDIFFHSKELVNVNFDDLREGDKVTFELADGPKGPNAIKVSRA